MIQGGALHVYGEKPAVGVNLDITMSRINRPMWVRSLCFERANADAMVAQLVITYEKGGWGPFTFIIESGVTTAAWSNVLEFPLPIGSTVQFVTTGLGAGDQVEGVMVLEEMPQ